MNLLKKQLLLVFILLVLVLSMTGCSGKGDTIQPPAGAPNGATTVEITGTVTVTSENGKVIVKSDANIMDGAKVELSINGLDSKLLANQIIVKNGDNLTAEFAIDPEWGSEVYGFVVMTVDSNGKQADHIFATYGENFELIEAENFIYDKDSYMLVIQSEKTSIK